MAPKFRNISGFEELPRTSIISQVNMVIDNKAYGKVPSRNRKIDEMIYIEMINDLKNRDIYLYNKEKFFKINKGKMLNYNIISKELKCEL